MATESVIAKTNFWVIGEEKQINIDVLKADSSTAQSMSGWSLRWRLQESKGGRTLIDKLSAGTAKITLGSSGTGTADDRASIEVDAVDYVFTARESGNYYHVLERNDSGSEQVLSFGSVYLHELQL